MEKLTTTDTPRKSGLMWKTLTLALCGVLSLSMISCGNTTSKDVLKQEKDLTINGLLLHIESNLKDNIEINTKIAYNLNKALNSFLIGLLINLLTVFFINLIITIKMKGL